MSRLGCLLMFAALGAIAVGISSWIDAAKSSDKPVAISYPKLTREMADKNPYVEVTDVFVCGFDYVEGKSHGDKAAWIPAVDASGGFASELRKWMDSGAGPEKFPRKGAISLLIKTKDISQEHIRELMLQRSVKGMLVDNDLGIIKGVMLEKHYPGTRLNSCLVLEEGATPAGVLAIAGEFFLGAVLLVGGLALIVLPKLGKRGPATDGPQPGFPDAAQGV